MSELAQEQSNRNTVPVEIPSLGTQPLLSLCEFLGGRNVVFVEQPFLRRQASVGNREFPQGISLANAVNVTPSLINYVLYIIDIV